MKIIRVGLRTLAVAAWALAAGMVVSAFEDAGFFLPAFMATALGVMLWQLPPLIEEAYDMGRES